MVKNIYGGGAKTNFHGLDFEQTTSLDEALRAAGYEIKGTSVIYEGKEIALSVSKNELYKKFLNPRGVDEKEILSKKLLPDEALFVISSNTIYIIEKKFQNCAGSVDEKLQTCDFKNKQYIRLFSPLGISVKYVYLCNDWFKQNCYRDVFEYIIDVGCWYFFNEIPIDFLELPVIG